MNNMKYSLVENLSERKGTISNLHGFVNRYLDGGFKTKWSGYWVPPHKYLDYFSFKINGVWLDSETLEGVEYGDKIIYHHEIGELSIEEHIKTPEKTPGFEVELNIQNNGNERKAIQTVMETGIDIRKKDQDIPELQYNLNIEEKRLNISSEDKKLLITSEHNFKIDGEPYTKEHYPGEKQRCFVPGNIIFRKEVASQDSENIKIEFVTPEGSFKTLKNREQELRNQELGRSFNYSIKSMKNLVYDREGLGIIAGHPWFQSYWARDTFWTVLGLIDAGYFELAENILENFAKHNLDSLIDLEKGKGDKKHREDTIPLYILAVNKLKRHHKLSDDLEKSIEGLMSKVEIGDKGIVQHGEKATWMDTLDRAPAVDIQALWLEAAGKMGYEKSEELATGLSEFKKEEFMKDFLGEKAPETINPSVPLMFGQITRKDALKYLEKINGEFSSMYGARTRSVTDPGYSGDGYHKGAAWGLTTMWAAAANLEYGQEKQGKNFLEKMTQFIDRNQPGALPEVVNAETGEPLGCSEQAWSAGLYIHVIDTYLLGIKVKKNKVVIDPVSNFTGKRLGKRIRDEEIDLEFENGKVEVLNDPDLNIEIKGEQNP